jgi:DUF1009 family protein
MGCKYCQTDYPNSSFQTTHKLYEIIGKGKMPDYITVTLQSYGNEPANIRVQSASGDKVNRGTFEINFCPMCGASLKVAENVS